MHQYIDSIKIEGNYDGDLEFSIAYGIFNFNIAEYLIIRDDNHQIKNLLFIKYLNNEQNENKNLIIFVNVNNNHFNLAYYNYSKLNMNYKYILNGDWGFGDWPNPQSPIPNPQSPLYNKKF